MHRALRTDLLGVSAAGLSSSGLRMQGDGMRDAVRPSHG
jgi:hypothetical protein